MRSKNILWLIPVILVIVIMFTCYIFRDNRVVFNNKNKLYDDNSCPTNLDLNDDKMIDEEDIKFLEEIIKSEGEEDIKYDYNGDKVVDNEDLDIYKVCYQKYHDLSFNINSDVIKYDEVNNIISRILLGTTVEELKGVIDSTDKTIEVRDKADNIMNDTDIIKTGDKLIIKNSSGNSKKYILSVNGDVLGDGTVSMDGAKKIASHIIDGNVLISQEYLLAADYDGDEMIRMNDVMKMIIDNE